MRTKVDHRSASKESYKDFCKKNPSIKLDYETWQKIIYTFSDDFRIYILETGEVAKLPFGFGDFTINKKKRKKVKKVYETGKEYINLPIDWKKTKERGKKIYNFNNDTEGFFFGWKWFLNGRRLKLSDLWYFKPFRTTSRLITHYLKINPDYQFKYQQWTLK